MSLPREELLHHIWQHRLFSSDKLKTTDGKAVHILRPGDLNTDAGPDFLSARLRIDGTEWAGNVEIHVRTSDWDLHGHQYDAAYSNLILHVVYQHDSLKPVGPFPTLELQEVVSDQTLRRYETLRNSTTKLPCQHQFMEVPELIRGGWLDSLLVRRLQRRTEDVDALLNRFDGDFEQAFTTLLFRAFGMKVNADAFEQLAVQIPWKVLAKHQDSLFQLEALLFGVAGFLSEPSDEYQRELLKEYRFLRHKYGVESMDSKVWRFLRLRPANFPSLRIAQLAAMFHETGPFLKWFTQSDPQGRLESLRMTPSSYWKTHYRFGKTAAPTDRRLGHDMMGQLLINAVVPFLFVAADRLAKPALRSRSVAMLERLRPEKNKKVNQYSSLGLTVRNAAESQALIELESHYCMPRNCLSCSVGAHILKRDL